MGIMAVPGAGKTTILSLIAGLIKPSSGEILIDGTPIKNVSTNVGYMFQRDNLFEWLNIYQNVLIGQKINHNKNCLSKTELKSLIKKYGLDGFEKAKPTELSGGMRQRAALIRTLSSKPKLLLLDEPFSALDYQTRLSVADDIYEILKTEGKTAILITHDIAEAISMSERVIILTKRPGSIKRELNITLTMREDGRIPERPSEARGAKEFATYYQEIWKELM